jgi:pseudomonalisin
MTPRLCRFLAAALAGRLLVPAAASAVQADEPLREVAPVPREVEGAVDAGRLDGDVRFNRAILVLPVRDPDGLSRLLASQQDPASPDFRKWLAPEEFGRRFGASEADVAALRTHLEVNGLEVEDVPAGRTTLLFSGRAADVERAFATEFHEVFADGAVRVANVRPARLPAGLAKRTAGLLSSSTFPRRRPLVRRAPTTNTSAGHAIAPADFATLYGLDALVASGLNGAGRTIAVIGDSNVNLDDTRYFRQYFGLAANDPQVVVNGSDPGATANEIEADLDIQWAGAVAPAAQVILVVSADNLPSYGVDLSVLYAVSNNLADIVTLSYGACENDFGPSDTTFYTNVWAQAAAQGMTVFVASGDTGADTCAAENQNATTGTIRSVNGLGSSPYATCVGGTQFLDTADPSAYWSPTNDPVTKKSVKSPIPETAWNESGAGTGLAATGGGLSVLFSRPPWQSVAGIPAGTARAVPDVALAAASHTPYLIFRGHTTAATGLWCVAGTSAGAPSFAGIAALLSQRAGSRLGNLNPLLYSLGAAQYGTSGVARGGPGPFNDVTTGTNTVPGVTGYDAGPGYDAVTGLGSINAAALAPALAPPAPATTDFTLRADPATPTLPTCGTVSVNLTLLQSAAVVGDAVATVSLAGLPAGVAAEFRPAILSDVSVGVLSRTQPATLNLASAGTTIAGTYRLDLTATSGSIVRHGAIDLTVGSGGPASAPCIGVQAPVILDVFGAGGSHYTSDLVAVNRGATDATLLLRFAQTPAPSTPGPLIARSLGPGSQLYAPDVISFLASNGYVLPADGSAKIGTLFATFAGASDPLTVFVGSRTSTPNPNVSVGGSFGTFSAAVPIGSAFSSSAWIYGLRENGLYRTNLGLVHAPGAATGVSSGPVSLQVQIYDGDSGAPVGAPLAKTLQPGEFSQYNSVLARTSTAVTNGYALVTLASGTDRFIAYGVVNDGSASGGGTSDGSFLPANATDGLVPIVLDVPGPPHFTTDLTLTNPTSSPVTVTLTYTASSAFSGAGSGTKTTTLAARQQLVVPNAIAYLRGLGLPIPSTGNQGGTLLVSGAPAVARTSNPNPDTTVGGTFGLAYAAVGTSARAHGEAWVYGLRQDANARTNLAIADARAGNPAGVPYVVDVFDADTGATLPVLTLNVTLAGGQWTQFNTILAGAGISHGFARVRPSSGTSDFVVYGVVNDGPTAGSRTSDGSYVPMVVVN